MPFVTRHWCTCDLNRVADKPERVRVLGGRGRRGRRRWGGGAGGAGGARAGRAGAAAARAGAAAAPAGRGARAARALPLDQGERPTRPGRDRYLLERNIGSKKNKFPLFRAVMLR